MTDFELALQYAPIIHLDEKDPFPILHVGYTIFREDGPSGSFRRKIQLDTISPDTACAIEYAYYMDYDIQHLYELEHAWVYLNDAGEITGAESSCHGKYLNAYRPGKTQVQENHIRLYAQPGKHALAADPDLFHWFPGAEDSCGRFAGIGGLDAPERYLTDIHLTEDQQAKVRAYIKDHFSFHPSWRFTPATITEDMYLPWNDLAERIPELLKAQLKQIL